MNEYKDLEVLTFKVDKSLKKLLAGVPNRSEFIRNAILTALNSVCPFCKGTGVLSGHRKEHWDNLLNTHQVEECEECHEIILECCK